MKKILSIAVALVLLIGLIPVAGMMNATAADTWTLVTDASTLQAGDQIVIAANTKGFVAAALSSQYLKNSAATFSENKTTITTLPADAAIFTLSGSADAWTLSNTNGALGATTVKKLAYGSGTTTWTITIDADNNATIQNATESYGRMLYNVNSPRFTTYTSNASASMLLPQIYRLVAGGDTDISDNTSTSTSASASDTTPSASETAPTDPTSSSTTTATQAPTDEEVDTSVPQSLSILGTTGTLVDKTITWTGKGFIFENAQGSSNSAIRTSDADHFRVYKSHETTISSTCGKNISQIIITATSSSYATAAAATATAAGYTATASGTTVTISLSGVSSITMTATAQWRLNKVEVVFEGGTTTTTTAATIYETPAEIMTAAYALEQGKVLSNSHVYTLSGVITNVDTVYNSEYSNVTVTMLVDGTDKEIQCFRLKGDGADLIGTNDKITVSGVIKNYNGTIEFDSGCTLDAYELSQVEVPIYETPAEIMDAAYALDEGATLSDGHAYTLTGVITEVNFAYDEGYGNASVTIAVDGTDKTIYCYKLAGTGADVVGVGDTVTVTGPIKNYKGKIEFDGCTLDSYVVKEEVPTFTGRDVTLGDDLDVGFYVDIPDAYDPANLSVVFEVNGNSTTVAIQPDAEGNYVIHLEVPAKDMTTVITAKVMDSSYTVHSEISTTVAEYADQIIAGDVDATAAEVAAATAMVNYGAMAQIYFNHNTDNLANVGNETDLSAADVSGIADLAVTGDSSNFIGASLVLKSRLAVRLYFTEQVEGSQYNSNGWYIEVTDIDAANLATTQNVTVGETTYSFSALSFAKQVIEGSYNANFQNLMKALVLYEAAASVL